MIALDTNILVRLVAGDDHAQERAVLRLLAKADETWFISDIVLTEFAWVLAGIYELSRTEIAAAVEALVQRSDLVFEDSTRVRRAIRYLATGGDFADFLILARAEKEGCSALATFDLRVKKKFPQFVVVPR